jgi:uncharacterized protein (DUF433 family)
MAVEQDATATVDADEEYRFLERRPGTWRRQLYLKGRNLPVGMLLWKMRVDQHTPVSAAEDYDLPLDQIREALDYARRHLDVIEQDNTEELQRLLDAGIIRDARTPD